MPPASLRKDPLELLARRARGSLRVQTSPRCRTRLAATNADHHPRVLTTDDATEPRILNYRGVLQRLMSVCSASQSVCSASHVGVLRVLMTN
jgi:hypothetical protein